jgi:ADP-heptose:LPS heptosyltransferase
VNEYLLLMASAMVSAVVNALGVFHGRGAGIERILVVKVDHVGDVVLATPALHALRAAHPNAVIDVLVAPDSRFVLEGNPSVSRVLLYDSPRFRRAASGGAVPESLAEAVRDRYSAVVELRGDWRTLRLPFRVGATRRVDRGTMRLKGWLARRVPPRGGRPPRHEVETNLEIVKPLLRRSGSRGLDPNRVRVVIHPSGKARESARSKLRSAGGDADRPFVCIHPGASRPAKAWNDARFAAVADWILAHYHAQVVFVGSEAERVTEAAVRASVKERGTIWLTGALTLDEVAALLMDAKLFLGNDGGPAHLAAAAGAPAVVLFGPTDPRRFGPWSDRVTILEPSPELGPGARPEDRRVNDIQVAEVTAAIARVLDAPARGAETIRRRVED